MFINHTNRSTHSLTHTNTTRIEAVGDLGPDHDLNMISPCDHLDEDPFLRALLAQQREVRVHDAHDLRSCVFPRVRRLLLCRRCENPSDSLCDTTRPLNEARYSRVAHGAHTRRSRDLVKGAYAYPPSVRQYITFYITIKFTLPCVTSSTCASPSSVSSTLT